MTFKNQRGEVPWYVIGLILAVLVLLVGVGAVLKLRQAQGQATDTETCETVLSGTCVDAEECPSGTKNPLGGCNSGICCVSTQ